MNAIAIRKYGEVSNLVAIEVDHPGKPSGYDLLVK